MTQNTKICVGIDVSKSKLDIALADNPEVKTFDYSASGLHRLLQFLEQHGPQQICLEATGGIERQLVEALHRQHFSVAVVNPRQIRDFARAANQLAKTDAIDARVIARFASLMNPRATPPLSPASRKLRDFTSRRIQVKQMLVQERNRLAATADRQIRRMIERAIRLYDKQLQTIEQQIARIIEADDSMQDKARVIASVPGLGPATVGVLISELPELGHLNRQQIARLVGVAPTNRDSGTLRGKRTTGGGRVRVRNALFMPLLVATRHNPTIRRFYQRLLENGKPKMVALIAAMRKLLTILNIMIRNQQLWRNTPQNT